MYVLYEENVKIINNTHGENGPYSGYCEREKDYRITDVSTVEPESYYHEHVVLYTDNDLPDHVYIVLVRHRDGDTFGTTTGNGYIVGVYDNENEADTIAKSIYDKTFDDYSPWNDYFSDLESVSVETEKVINYKIVKKKY